MEALPSEALSEQPAVPLPSEAAADPGADLPVETSAEPVGGPPAEPDGLDAATATGRSDAVPDASGEHPAGPSITFKVRPGP